MHWAVGRCRAEALFASHPLYDQSDYDFDAWTGDGCSMMEPCGSMVGVTELNEDVANDSADVVGGAAAASGLDGGDESLEDLVDGGNGDGSAHSDSNVDMPSANGKKAFKATCVRELFSGEAIADDNPAKSTDRIKRARGYIRYQVKVEPGAVSYDASNPDTQLMIGDPYATLAQTQNGVCLVVLSFQRSAGCGSTSVVQAEHLDHPELELHGRTMEIDSVGVWSTRLAGSSTKVSGAFISPLNPDLRGATYWFDALKLDVIKADLWQRLKPQKSKLAVMNSHTPFDPVLLVTETMPVAEPAVDVAPKLHQCNICNAKCLGDELRLHVSSHNLKGQIQSHGACGFCGKPAGCSSKLIDGSQKGRLIPQSSCNEMHKFQVRRIETRKIDGPSNPCSNMPMQCPDCTVARLQPWLYNIFDHYQTHHADSPRAKQLTRIQTLLMMCVDGTLLPNAMRTRVRTILSALCFDEGLGELREKVTKLTNEFSFVLMKEKARKQKRSGVEVLIEKGDADLVPPLATMRWAALPCVVV